MAIFQGTNVFRTSLEIGESISYQNKPGKLGDIVHNELIKKADWVNGKPSIIFILSMFMGPKLAPDGNGRFSKNIIFHNFVLDDQNEPNSSTWLGIHHTSDPEHSELILIFF
jgi:hypothetical protein